MIQVIVASPADCVVEVSKWPGITYGGFTSLSAGSMDRSSLPDQYLGMVQAQGYDDSFNGSNGSVLCEHPAPVPR